ncbi:unnamed protein product [Zymoseptoria tritici ST99CH_3D7]|uniref:Ubiquitin-like protease family profile domain-containing protein n=1 Tax=Zymoseptoria tritici (strain ST99CH_3D7) TaxID=1276538 RepID=A0A1X7S2Y5_ZYMT9|nr:unnamed protein product [Zymoseptoria tritici ST99CH_3D7]
MNVQFPHIRPAYMDGSPNGDVSMEDAPVSSPPSVHYSPNSPTALPPRSILKKRTRAYEHVTIPEIATEHREIISPIARLSKNTTNNILPPISEHYPGLVLGQPGQQQVPRSFGGQVVNIVLHVPAFFGAVWRFINPFYTRREHLEIVAVETHPNGRKRRCVAVEDLHVPGAFPISPSPNYAAQILPTERPAAVQPVFKAQRAEIHAPRRRHHTAKPATGRSYQDAMRDMNKMLAEREAGKQALKEVNERDAAAGIKNIWAPRKQGRSRDDLVDALASRASQAILSKNVAEDDKRRPSRAILNRRYRHHVQPTDAEMKQLNDMFEAQTVAEEAAERKKAEEEAELERQKIAAQKEAERKKLEEEEEAERKKLAEQEETERALLRSRIIRPVDPKWQEQIYEKMSTGAAHTVLATTADGVEMTRTDFGKILPQAIEHPGAASNTPPDWLNDEAVNGWYAAICARRNEQDGYVKGPNNTPALVAYNTAWITTWNKAGGAQGIKTWSRRKGISGAKLLKAEKVFFPINSGAHWTLLIISPKDRKIQFLDSLHGRSTPWFAKARQWLQMELGKDYKPDEWTEDMDSQSVGQMNLSDCGVFTCINGLVSAKGRKFEEISATNGMKEAREMMVAVLMFGGFKGDWEL